MAEPSLIAEPTTLIGQIAGGAVYALGLLIAAGLGIWQYISQRKEKAKPDYAIMEAAEIADMAPARELVRTLSPKLENVFRLVDQLLVQSADRTEQQREMNRKLDQVMEMLRQATEERRIAVARQDERDKWHRPAE